MKAYPQLTQGERDFCSFVKLNLSNKEIAHLLQISPESVITKKYRILKKLELAKETNFHTWLNNL
jgi:DNA-binding CsgD family transcriptional regulator